VSDPQKRGMFAGKYRLGERIGAGGMAEVFRAERVGTQGFERTVAIKRVLPRWSAHPRYAEKCIHEARLMAALCHPQLLRQLPPARAPIEHPGAAPQAQQPILSESHLGPRAVAMQGARPWAWAAVLLLLAGSVTGWLLGRDGREPLQRLSHIGGQSTEGCQSKKSLRVHDAQNAPAEAPAPSHHEPATPAQERPTDEPGLAHVTSLALVEMF
jgi:hypothetical protein